MRMVAVKIAMRFLKFGKYQTILIILGFAIGIAVQVFVGTLLGSLQLTFLDRTVGNSSHITVLPAEDTPYIEDWDSYVEKLDELDDLKEVSVALDGNALFNTANNKTFTGLVRGFELKRADGIYEIYDRIYQGEAPIRMNHVLIGRENQEEFGLELNDELGVVLPNGTQKSVTIAGFYDFNVATLNQRWVISTLETAQELFGLEPVVTSIEMQVYEVFEADKIAKEVRSTIDNDMLKITNWEDDNQEFLSALQAQGSSSYMIQIFVVASVIIAIASVLSISVLQKSRQIGILKAMGITDRKASHIFLVQGFVLGLAGGVCGVLIGLGLFTGFIVGSGIIDPYYDWGFVIGSVFVAIIASTGAALIPARKSSKLDPIEVIRNG